jgi:hypothetical protein
MPACHHQIDGGIDHIIHAGAAGRAILEGLGTEPVPDEDLDRSAIPSGLTLPLIFFGVCIANPLLSRQKENSG